METPTRENILTIRSVERVHTPGKTDVNMLASSKMTYVMATARWSTLTAELKKARGWMVSNVVKDQWRSDSQLNQQAIKLHSETLARYFV